ncbi:MFS transporter [Thioclava atlantica]|uniref:Major facilitator transporter n=1 Tax=Thioclava atlantica TaxID=1317124 RepID=A0A085U0F2_9RHOB|nr:MFS transporter [Thioclava atlantica]KFE36449.1 major facilitator transporter [Thioclava atlantica]
MAGETGKTIQTDIPARMDRLPWSRFHLTILIALGVTWILDGLEVTLKGAVSSVLQEPESLGFSSTQIGMIASFYITGAVIGALLFGYLTDRFGRRMFFFITLAVYLVGALATAFSWNLWSFVAFRFITGLGIGGEYAAINSTIDEMMPARVRGQVALGVNGSYWIGAALGALSTIVLLNPDFFPVDLGWRLGFGIGAVLGGIILFMRRHLPESPRWLATHDRMDEAEKITAEIEERTKEQSGEALAEVPDEEKIEIRPQKYFSLLQIMKAMFSTHRKRALLGLVLMGSQAFLYNAIFFTYALVLSNFFDVPSKNTGLYLVPFAVGNFLGVIVLGRLFDTIGRRTMISLTYGLSAIILMVTGFLFAQGVLSAVTLTALWSVIFFFASAAASSAYLTVSEVFPLETRALAIAIFYSIGTAAGGIVSPWIFGMLIDTGSAWNVFYGYLFAGALMLVAAITEAVIGIDAEQKSLEEVADPISAESAG